MRNSLRSKEAPARLRFLFRYVHRKLHELLNRSSWSRPSGNGTIPAVYAERVRLAKTAGMQVMKLLADDVRPRDIITPAAFENALTTDMALGCSTNSALHLLAIAHEADITLDLHMITRSVRRLRTCATSHRQDITTCRISWRQAESPQY